VIHVFQQAQLSESSFSVRRSLERTIELFDGHFSIGHGIDGGATEKENKELKTMSGVMSLLFWLISAFSTINKLIKQWKWLNLPDEAVRATTNRCQELVALGNFPAMDQMSGMSKHWTPKINYS